MPEVPASYQRIEGTNRSPVPGATRVGDADPAERASVSIRLRRRPGAPPLGDPAQSAEPPARLTPEEFAATYGADPADIERIETFGREHGLTVEESSIPRRTVVLAGTVAQLSEAFAVELGRYQTEQTTYRGREGHVHLPADLAPIVEGVFGLDNRQQARPLFRPAATAQAVTALTPPEVAKLYDFPSGISAAGQCIGLLEFGGGYHPADITAWFTGLGLTPPTLADVGVDGAANSPGSPDDTEVVLDIDVAGAVAQGARIAVYFAPWTEQGWVDVVSTAIHDAVNRPGVISISWGWPELESILGLTWTQAAMNAVSATFQEAAVLGVTVLAASGDQGSDCQIGDHHAHVIYPGCDPYLTSCGGTEIENVSGTSFSEVLWNDNGASGGGVSVNFAVPAWQASVPVPASVNDGHRGRGIPDVAGNADPNSGYMLTQNGGRIGPIGGTSATAPLYAGLVALLNAHLNDRAGYLNPTLYQVAASGVFRDVNCCGSNAFNGAPGYPVGNGWDATTGLGSINGMLLLDALQGRVVTATAWSANRLDAFVLGTDAALYHKWWAGAWGPSEAGFERLGGVCLGAPDVVSWSANRLDAFVIGTDRALYHKWWDETAWGPSVDGFERLGGVCVGSPAAVSWEADRLDVFVIGTDLALYHKWWDINAWGPSVDGFERLGGICVGPPTAVSWAADRLDVFVIGTDLALYHKWWDGNAWGPSIDGFERLGGVCTSPPVAVSWAADRLDIFVIGTDHALYHKWWDGNAWGPSVDGFERLGGVCVGTPAAVSWEADRLDVFVIGTDGALYHKWWDGNAWGPSVDGFERLGGVCVGTPAVVSWEADRLDVFVVGTDAAMYHKWWDGKEWGPSETGFERLGGVIE
jgi:hypothetical protein